MITILTQYDAQSRAFHLLAAIAAIAAFILVTGHFERQMHQGLDTATQWAIVVRESLCVLVLTVLRLLWVAVRSAKHQFDMPGWKHLTAQAPYELL